jgi:predicted enzyme related to lactoylglutathione lyase
VEAACGAVDNARGSDEEEVRNMGAPVTWFEISTSGAKAVREFYAEIFGWNLQVIDEYNYALVDTSVEGAIAGGIGEARGPNQVVFYIEVDDPQAYLDRIEEVGGKTVVPVTEIPGLVTFAQFADPEGNVVGLVKAM